MLLLPTLNLYKIDGDAYAVNSFSADALAGLPSKRTEPIFGSGLGPGVRMVFNQSLTLTIYGLIFPSSNPTPFAGHRFQSDAGVCGPFSPSTPWAKRREAATGALAC